MDIVKRITYIAFIISLLACKKEEGNSSRIESIAPYHTIQLNDAFEVELIEQDEYMIEIHGTESFVEKTQFSIQDCTLSIRNDKKFKWSSPKGNNLKVVFKGKNLKAVHANESCIIKSLNHITTREFGIILKSKANTADILLNNKVFYYWNNFPCGGKLTLRGQTDELKIWNTAIMTVDASSLSTKKALVENDSKGDCIVNVSSELEYKIAGEGNIIVYGSASIQDKGSSNSGRLIRR